MKKEEQILDKINRFKYKLLPQAKLSRNLSKEAIDLMVKEAVEVTKLADLHLVGRLKKQLGDQLVILTAVEDLVDALCENLRFGRHASNYLKQALARHCIPAAPTSSLLIAAPTSSLLIAAPTSSLLPAPPSSLLTAAPTSSLLPAASTSSLLPAASTSSLLTAAPTSSLLPAASTSSLLTAAPTSSLLTAAPTSSLLPATTSSLQYIEKIEQRNALREDYLYACSLLQCSKQKDILKAYLKLKQLNQIHEIIPAKVEWDINVINKSDGGKERRNGGVDEERRKYVLILSLEESLQSEFFEVAFKIGTLLRLDLDLMASLQPLDLLRSIKNWPVFRTRVFNLLNRACSEANNLSQVQTLAKFLQNLLTADLDHLKPKKSWKIEKSGNDFNEVKAELLNSLDSNVNMSKFYKNELLVYLSSYLSLRRTA